MASNTDVVKKTTITWGYYVSVSVSVCLLQTKAPISKPDLQNSRNYLQCPLPLLGTSVDALQYVMNFQF